MIPGGVLVIGGGLDGLVVASRPHGHRLVQMTFDDPHDPETYMLLSVYAPESKIETAAATVATAWSMMLVLASLR